MILTHNLSWAKTNEKKADNKLQAAPVSDAWFLKKIQQKIIWRRLLFAGEGHVGEKERVASNIWVEI